MNAPIFGVVLAAGRSSRMGAGKPLLEVDGTSFLERAISVLRDGGCDGVLAVLRRGDLRSRELAERAGAEPLENPDPLSEQVDSLRLALDAVPAEAAALVALPVDHPRVDAGTVRELISAFRAHGAPVVRPSHRGEPGHPTLFAASLFDELRASDLAEGARSVILRHASAVHDVEVEDPGAATDVNTPEDYRREVEGS